MRILSIETSCDETAVTVLVAEGDLTNATFTVKGNALYSQAQKHAQYGGVYPSLAKREHAANLVPLLESALQEAKLCLPDTTTVTDKQVEYLHTLLQREEGLSRALIAFLKNTEKPSFDAIAVTQGPGLEPALWVGINFARALAYMWDIPIIPVNHLEGHMVASSVASTKNARTYEVTEVVFPALGLIISGGHTELVYTEAWGEYKVVGATRDDSIGEAFDKVARLLGLPYPGGPKLSELAEQGRKSLLTRPVHLMSATPRFPRPMLTSGDLDFSFSGLKTAVLYKVRDMGELNSTDKMLIASEFEEAVSDVIVAKVREALNRHPSKTLILGGGVSANSHIRKRLEHLLSNDIGDCSLRLPATHLSTDNAVMIGMAGYFMHLRNTPTMKAGDDIRANGNMGF